MSMTVQPTDTLRLTATFLDYNPVTGTEQPIPTDSMTGRIDKYNGTAYVLETTFAPLDSPTDDSVYYDWTPGSVGKFKITFEATIQADNIVRDVRVFYVGELDPAITLGSNKSYSFLGELHPIYLDPEEILQYYPSGNLVEITEYIYWFSRELEALTGKTEITDLTPLMHDYLVASTLCRLSRLYIFEGGLSGFSKAESFTLGDLTIRSESSQTTGSKSSDNLGAATTWCEIAAILQTRLTRGAANLKSVVKGSNFENPMPSRQLRRFE